MAYSLMATHVSHSTDAAALVDVIQQRLRAEGRPVPAGCSADEVDSLQKTVQKELGVEIPPRYRAFLLQSDGLSYGGVELFGTGKGGGRSLLSENLGNRSLGLWPERPRLVLGVSPRQLYIYFQNSYRNDFYAVEFESGRRLWLRSFERFLGAALREALGVPEPVAATPAGGARSVSVPTEKSLGEWDREERELFVRSRVSDFWDDYRAGKHAGMSIEEAGRKALQLEEAALDEWCRAGKTDGKGKR
jgi:hypothetical protein